MFTLPIQKGNHFACLVVIAYVYTTVQIVDEIWIFVDFVACYVSIANLQTDHHTS